jgi:hypothetical protein
MSSLAARYGAPSPLRRRLVVAGAVAVATGFLGWLAWAAWFHATPAVQSNLVTWQIVDDHEATATVSVTLADGEAASCVVRAVAADHTPVGEVAFEPEPGSNQVSVRTERRATTVTLLGCTAEGQPRPR